MRTYDSDGWIYTGRPKDLMRFGDLLSPTTDPNKWENIKLNKDAVLKFFKGDETND